MAAGPQGPERFGLGRSHSRIHPSPGGFHQFPGRSLTVASAVHAGSLRQEGQRQRPEGIEVVATIGRMAAYLHFRVPA